MSNELDDVLQHFGKKGMKWGVRKDKDAINSKERSIKKGTTIQNISNRQLDMSKGRHMYGSYTKYDNEAYTDMMGNFMYGGKAYKNEFVIKKDIKLPSDKQLVENFVELVKSNPKQVSKDMAAAYNDTHIFLEKKAKHFEKKISKIEDADSKRGEKLAKQYISVMVSDKASKSRADFMGTLIKKGFDGMSDVNDRDTNYGTQDPLIIFNPNKSLGKVKSVKLEKEELDKYYKKFLLEQETRKERYDVKEVQHKQGVNILKPDLQDILQHHGVKGMHWGKRKAGGTSVTKPKVEKATIKDHVNSIKREHGWKKQLKNADNMSTKEIQKISSRAQLENDLKRLSKKKRTGSTNEVGTDKDKRDYLNRANMSDQELFRKVQRLRAKSSLNRNANDATNKQKEIAKKVLHIAAPLVLQYALTKTIGKKDVVSAATNAAVNLGGPKAKLIKNLMDQAKKVKHGDDLDDVLMHSLLDDPDEILQHFGVKGMHWGKRLKARGAARKERIKSDADTVRRRKKGEITRTQAKDEKWQSFHKEQSNNKHYKKEYDRLKAKGIDDKKAMRAAYQVAQTRKKANIQLAVTATVVGLKFANAGVKIGKEAANNPDNIRKAKNVAQALKRSPVRYVDGSKMKNVIN